VLLLAYLLNVLILEILSISNVPQQVSSFIYTLTLMLFGYISYKKYNLVIGRFIMLLSISSVA